MVSVWLDDDDDDDDEMTRYLVKILFPFFSFL